MKKLFVVADTHFKSYKDYPQWLRHHYTYEYITTWNSKVRKCDTVIHLGDVAWSEGGLPILNKLNGNKILVLGNHDTLPMVEYKKYFTEVYQYYRVKDILFSHAPVVENHKWFSSWRIHDVGIKKVDTWKGYDKNIIYCGRSFPNISLENIVGNVHGHFHSYGKSRFNSPWPNAQAVHYKTGWELFTVTDTPILFDTIRKNIKKQRYEKEQCKIEEINNV